MDEIKNDRFYRHGKTSKITLLLSLHFFGQKCSLQKKGLQGIIESYRGLQNVTRVAWVTSLHGVTSCNRLLQGVTGAYKGLQGSRRDYKRLHGVQEVSGVCKGL